MFPEFEVCNPTRSTISEEPFSRYSESPYAYLVFKRFQVLFMRNITG